MCRMNEIWRNVTWTCIWLTTPWTGRRGLAPQFGRGSRLAEEMMGRGLIVRHTKDNIYLDDDQRLG